MPEVFLFYLLVATFVHPFLFWVWLVVVWLVIIIAALMYKVDEVLKARRKRLAANPQYAAYMRKKAWREAARRRMIDRKLAARVH